MKRPALGFAAAVPDFVVVQAGKAASKARQQQTLKKV